MKSQKEFMSIHPLIQKLLPAHRGKMWVWITIVLLSGILALVFDHRSPENVDGPIEPENPETAATFIPAGFVLVPIEVANYESLDSILGKFGVVDLYTVPLDPNARPKKIATRIKILRAPLNPNHFAVLALEDQSQELVGFSGPLTVVVQNPKSSGTKIVKTDNQQMRVARRATRKISRVTVEVSDVGSSSEDQNESL